MLNLILQVLFKHSVFSNRTLFPHLKTLMADPPRYKPDQNSCSGKTGVRHVFRAPRHPHRSEAAQRIIWKKLFQHSPNWFADCNFANFCSRGHGVTDTPLWSERAPGVKGCISNSCAQAPELLGTASGRVSSLLLRSRALISSRTTQRHCPQTLALRSRLVLVYPFGSRWQLKRSPLISWLRSSGLRPELHKHHIVWHWQDSW